MRIALIFLYLSGFILNKTQADISHLFTPEYSIFPQHPFQIAFQQPPFHHHHQQQQQQQQTSLGTLYGPPPHHQQAPPLNGYPNPIVTPAPVAPSPPSSTTEFTLPEIVENRQVNEQQNDFIHLRSQYLPPEEVRPSFESPKPPNHSGSDAQNHHVYYYPRPSSATTTTTTTTEQPQPIIVADPIIPIPISELPFQGYDYNAPTPLPQRPSTPASAYLPPPALFGLNEIGNGANTVVTSTKIRVRIKEMRCLQQQQLQQQHHQQRNGGYFHASLKIESFIPAAPNVDNDAKDKRCEIKISRTHLVIDILAEDFTKCGVHSCGKDLCLRIRFPAIRGMRTEADSILTLHCKSQERFAIKTHAFKMGVANDIQSRNIGTYAHGGSQNLLRTHVELLRRTINGFTRHLEANGAVQLGEELLLRAHVVPGDGWNYTKLSDINLQRISSAGEILNSASLITSRGCINPSMQAICDQLPVHDPPLGHKFSFKAVMFQGMHSGDELMVSMRITACLEQQDCYISQHECNSDQFGGGATTRRRRDTNNSTKLAEISEISRISFRVINDDADEEMIKHNNIKTSTVVTLQPRSLVLATSCGFVMLITCLGVIAAWKLKQ